MKARDDHPRSMDERACPNFAGMTWTTRAIVPHPSRPRYVVHRWTGVRCGTRRLVVGIMASPRAAHPAPSGTHAGAPPSRRVSRPRVRCRPLGQRPRVGCRCRMIAALGLPRPAAHRADLSGRRPGLASASRGRWARVGSYSQELATNGAQRPWPVAPATHGLPRVRATLRGLLARLGDRGNEAFGWSPVACM
jgi:hypothetical protein